MLTIITSGTVVCKRHNVNSTSLISMCNEMVMFYFVVIVFVVGGVVQLFYYV
jgi:hypothetical protein